MAQLEAYPYVALKSLTDPKFTKTVLDIRIHERRHVLSLKLSTLTTNFKFHAVLFARFFFLLSSTCLIYPKAFPDGIFSGYCMGNCVYNILVTASSDQVRSATGGLWLSKTRVTC